MNTKKIYVWAVAAMAGLAFSAYSASQADFSYFAADSVWTNAANRDNGAPNTSSYSARRSQPRMVE